MVTLRNYLEHLNFTVSQNKNDFLASLYKRYQVNFELQYQTKLELQMVQMVGIDACMEIYGIKGTEKGLIIKYVSKNDFIGMKENIIPEKIRATVDYAYTVTDMKSIAVLAICDWGNDDDGSKLYNQQIVAIPFQPKMHVNVMNVLHNMKNKKVDKRDYEKEIAELRAEIKDLKEIIKDLKETVKELSAKLTEALKPKKENDIFVAVEKIEKEKEMIIKEKETLQNENKELKESLKIEKEKSSKFETKAKLLQIKIDNPEHFGYVKVEKDVDSNYDFPEKNETSIEPEPGKKDEKPLDKALREYDEKVIPIKTKSEEWANSNTEQQKVLAKLNSYKTENGKTPKSWNRKTRDKQITYLRVSSRKLKLTEKDQYKKIVEIIEAYELNF